MKGERGGFRGVRHEQRFEGLEKDPYKEWGKPHDPARCPECGAVFHRGRWTWEPAPEGAHEHLCPACRRIREQLPAGFVSLKGEFFDAHRDEILARVRHCETAEKRDHPLQRIMAVQPEGEGLVVTTTDIHLARRIGDALHDAWKGELKEIYSNEENLVRVYWSR